MEVYPVEQQQELLQPQHLLLPQEQDLLLQEHAQPNYDEYFIQLKAEADEVLAGEPEMEILFRQTILAPNVNSFEDAVAQTLCHRLLISAPTKVGDHNNLSSMCPVAFLKLAKLCLRSPLKEHGATIAEAIRRDAMAVVERDPAMDTLLEVVLFAKGFSALVAHRVAFRLWHMKRKFGALFIQSQASAVFGVDIHPLARIGKGVMMDHATSIVVGETATIGEGCTILHGVTLGGTGKDHGDRHPKVGRHVLIGAGSLLLGNITIGDSAKIGAGSVLLRNIPAFATAVGVPAKIIGRADETDPGEDCDTNLRRVSLLSRKLSTVTATTESPSFTEEDLSSIGSSSNHSDASPSLTARRQESFNQSEAVIQQKKVWPQEKDPRKKYKQKTRRMLSDEDEFCPYREYMEVAKRAPKGTITLVILKSVLSPEGVSECVIGASMFELDHAGRGYIKVKAFLEEGPAVISRNCNFPIQKATQLVKKAAALVSFKE